MNKKDRRHSGWYTPKTDIPKKELIKYNLDIPLEYDDWNNYRDSYRDIYKDNKLIKDTIHNYRLTYSYGIIRIKMNNKQKKLLARRKARKDRK
jgi:hypothetical protein